MSYPPPPYDPNRLPPTRQMWPPQQHGEQDPPGRTYGGPPQAYQPPAYGPPQQPVSPQYGTPTPGQWQQPPPERKKMGTGRILLIVAGSFLGLCLMGIAASAGRSQDDPPASVKQAAPAAKGNDKPAPAKKPEKRSTFDVPVGTTLTLDTDDNVQEWTVSAPRYRTSCGGIGEADNGGFLIVDVKMLQKEGTGSVNPLFLNFVSDDGTTANSMSGAFSGCEKNSLDSSNSLRPGQKRAGQVAFDVASEQGSVELTPGLGSDTVGSWKIS